MNTQNENWKPVSECNGEYSISNFGRVKSYKRGRELILKPYLVGDLGNQYFAIEIWVNGKQKMCKIHRLIALAFIPNLENNPQVNHKDGDKLNNNIDNLEWCTSKENIQHAWDNGLFESTRLAISKARSKPVVDITNGKKYNSLTEACKENNQSYSLHRSRHHQSSKLQRFFFC